MKRLLIFILLLAANAQAYTYHVKIGGNDNDAGTSWATAWATTSKVASTMAAGDTVFFGTGIWRVSSRIYAPDNTGNEFTVYACSAFVDGIAELWGSQSLTGWSAYSGYIYRASFNYSGATLALFQSDANLLYVASLGELTEPGQWYWDDVNNYVYAWCYDNDDPDNNGMEISSIAIFGMEGTAHRVQVYGLKLRYCWRHQIVIAASANRVPDYIYLDHLDCRYTGDYQSQQNTSAIYCGTTTIAEDSYFSHGSRIRKCNIDWVTNISDNVIHHYAIGVYAFRQAVIESCYTGPHVGEGILIKSSSYVDIADSAVAVRYNFIDGYEYVGIEVYLECRDIWIYGNTIIGNPTAGMAIQMFAWTNSGTDDGYNYIYNNTIYNCDIGLYPRLTGYGDSYIISDRNFKYNIIYDDLSATNTPISLNGSDPSWDGKIDSNMYYLTGYSFTESPSSGNFSTWQGWGWDTHSTFGTNPNFTNPSGDDFSRNSSSQEMNVTYGGRTWTRYGAWQPSGSGGGSAHRKLNLWRH